MLLGGGGCFVNTSSTTSTIPHHPHHHRNNNHKEQYDLLPPSAPHHLHHPKAPSAPLPPSGVGGQAPPESFTERFSTMLDQCQRKIRLLQAPTALFSSLVMKARRKDKDAVATEEHKLYLEEAVLERKIPETDLRQLVELPAGLGYHEWLASHTIDFFQHINLVYGTIAEFCTLSGCSDMMGPATRPYLWFDEKGKKVRVAAPQYIDYVMTFTQKTINDESIFPTKFENEFPVSFESIVKKIHRLLFHVLAHLYHSHFRELLVLSLHAHLNCIFAHFTLFNERFCLIDEKETEILQDLVLALRLHPSEAASKADAAATVDASDEDAATTADAATSDAAPDAATDAASDAAPSNTTAHQLHSNPAHP